MNLSVYGGVAYIEPCPLCDILAIFIAEKKKQIHTSTFQASKGRVIPSILTFKTELIIFPFIVGRRENRGNDTSVCEKALESFILLLNKKFAGKKCHCKVSIGDCYRPGQAFFLTLKNYLDSLFLRLPQW